MTKNIKEIGKELLGKSLNSFHRKTGLTQLEKNNEMQDGILNGILSQVDDAYIEKTEQSNVIHLDGSGDGVVIVDSIEGNTMVNLNSKSNYEIYSNVYKRWVIGEKLKPNTTYTIITNISNEYLICCGYNNNLYVEYSNPTEKIKFTTGGTLLQGNVGQQCSLWVKKVTNEPIEDSILLDSEIMLLEGDWTNKEIPPYFEGMKSSFEENKEEDKYKIEILSKNKNLMNFELARGYSDNWNALEGTPSYEAMRNKYPIPIEIDTKYCIEVETEHSDANFYIRYFDSDKKHVTGSTICTNQKGGKYTYVIKTPNISTIKYANIHQYSHTSIAFGALKSIKVAKSSSIIDIPHFKSNKIKLLINEPLRKFGDIKDKLYIKDNRLIVKRKLGEVILSGDVNENWRTQDIVDATCLGVYLDESYGKYTSAKFVVSDKLPSKSISGYTNTANLGENIVLSHTGRININILRSKLSTQDVNGFKQWLQSNPVKVVYELLEPTYEEVTNEYGEPIIMEGYENGTIYIDSTIVPTTTVRYTPKMESFKTVKEVNNNNVMLTNDINDMIVPYMMEVDLMIMEKEVALMNQKNIRKIGAEDMTSMQKRTQQLLERLIKGRILTEQECKTRVTTYLNANKITDEQAEELMLLIDEVYA